MLDELDILDQGGPLCVFVLGKLRAEERDRKMHLIVLLGICQGKGSSGLDYREKNALTFIIFHFTIFSFRAWHSAIFPSVIPTYSNLYVKPTLIIFCVFGKIHKMMETISVKSQKNFQKCEIYLFLCSVSDWMMLG